MRRAPALFTLPYDSGHRNFRMGMGPARLQQELNLPAEEIHPETEWRAEIATAFQLYRQLAKRIAASRASMPIVLAGNCGACIGTAAGVGTDNLGVIWFDAHGDFNTPETTTTGFLDGMGLSILTGRCFRPLSATIPGFKPLPFARVVHAGGHDLDDSERDDFARLGVDRIEPHRDPAAAIDALAQNCSRLVIHIDLDVLDTQHGRANHYASSGGMSPDEVAQIVARCAEQMDVVGISLASYDPSYDEEGRVAKVAKSFIDAALS